MLENELYFPCSHHTTYIVSLSLFTENTALGEYVIDCTVITLE